MQEFEMKLRYGDFDRLRARLRAAGGTHTRTVEQERHLIFAAGSLKDQVLRLRSKEPGGVLTWKGPPVVEDAAQRRDEVSCQVADLESMRDLLERLGFRQALEFTKRREYWQVADAKLVLDDLPFGQFVEIEAAPDGIERLIKTLELTGAERVEEVYPDPND